MNRPNNAGINSTIGQLHATLSQLKHELNELNLLNSNWFSTSDVFNSSSFFTKSDELKDYVKELENNIERAGQVSDEEHMSYLSQRIAEQFACFKNFTNSSHLSKKYSKQSKKHFSKVNRVKQMAATVTKSSQALYQELSKLQEYERRLLDMVLEKQDALKQATPTNRNELQNVALLTQQRLGRCRQAISGIEEQIQSLDNSNFNKTSYNKSHFKKPL